MRLLLTDGGIIIKHPPLVYCIPSLPSHSLSSPSLLLSLLSSLLPLLTPGSTGVIRTAGELDFDSGETSYDIIVIATDSGMVSQSASTSFQITITDVNDCTPTFELPSYTVSILEDAQMGMWLDVRMLCEETVWAVLASCEVWCVKVQYEMWCEGCGERCGHGGTDVVGYDKRCCVRSGMLCMRCC